ncbi:hypothetical protein DPEC_G00311010 [Dallia pectoralis]|uniref:Uncharacterized protein n=1 Tax=Dallia pectoralis TaxID=75939 RepID=A0ACC2FB28_DALPE|nr:hypothetical protein DPEC_G00311010 [Dallia pectoralis]
MSGGEASTLEAHSGGSLPPGQGTPGTKRTIGDDRGDLVGTMSGGTGIGTPMASTGMELACVGVEDPMSGGTGVGTPLASTGTELGMAGGDPMDSGGGGV